MLVLKSSLGARLVHFRGAHKFRRLSVDPTQLKASATMNEGQTVPSRRGPQQQVEPQGQPKQARRHRPRNGQSRSGGTHTAGDEQNEWTAPGVNGQISRGSSGQRQAQFQGPSQRRAHTDPRRDLGPSGGMNGSLRPAQPSSTTQSHMTSTLFATMPISPLTKRALAEVMQYEACTDVQAAAIPAALAHQDVICKARTGTGKTLAYLIPAIEQMLRSRDGAAGGANPSQRRKQISTLIISPARELAMQINTEAKQLTKFSNFRCQAIMGGTNMNSEQRLLERETPDILTATPGRLLDHLQNAHLLPCLSSLQVLIFDEADRLLDMGFRPDIDKLLRLLPPKTSRQTVLFSATFPANTKELCDFALRPNPVIVDCVGEDTEQTAKRVQQSFVVAPLEHQMPTLLTMLQQHMQQEPDYKVLVFFTTANLTALHAELFQAMQIEVLEIHSRKSQPQRQRAADAFRTARQAIMFTSDVSARGVDYPDVSLVIQVGLASDRDQYIHRVGRTARAGKTGQAALLLTDFEEAFVSRLHGLPLQRRQLSGSDIQAAQQHIQQALPRISPVTKSKAYQAWLGFYKGSMKLIRKDAAQLVELANTYSAIMGCSSVPSLEAKTVGKMGLKGVPGLVIAPRDASSGGGQGSRGGGRGGRGRSGGSFRGGGRGRS
ncbi:hypothetical protein WJX74_005774 [Apatococcus lobatus]|uniref:ATP-dependent RNA helicase n=1 Tax=Apatococcus lobatus TaxID=904363 RepID=A0AAW1SBS8_9CHLO